jgi:glycosyltransferase involved in cell wall biosynthesis
MKSLLLIYGALGLGGIETLIVRMAKAWHERGVAVTVLLLSKKGDPGLMAELSKYSRVVYLSELSACPSYWFERVPMIGWFLPLSKGRASQLLGAVDHIHFFDSFSMLMGFRLLRLTGLQKKMTGGVYHQNEYAYPRLRKTYFSDCFSRLFSQISPARNVIFFNEISKRSLGDDYSKNFDEAPILPIGIDLSRLAMRPMDEVDRSKVVSIGRITSFKTYNLEFLKTVADLKRRGTPIHYDVYGDGDQLPLLKKTVSEHGLDDVVHLHGSLPYSKFVDAIRTSLVFLGSGTALIEAAACGVPALIGIESQEDDQTYGFLHEMPGLSYHEKGLPVSTRPYGEFVEWLASLTAEEYAGVCRRSREKAFEFSIDIFLDRFTEADRNAQTVSAASANFSLLRLLGSITLDRALDRYRGKHSFWKRYDLVRI